MFFWYLYNPKFRENDIKKSLPVWYGGGIGNNRNALCGVGHLSYAGFFLYTDYEYQNPFQRSRDKADQFL